MSTTTYSSVYEYLYRGLLIAGLDAVLAIYSKAGGEYANTIRWSRRGGLWESIKILWYSRSARNTPNPAWWTMLRVFLVSIVLLVLDKLASINIHPTISQSQSSQSEMITSPQIIFPSMSSTFQKWASTVRYGDDITAAMMILINDTTNIPNFDNNLIYIPQTSNYEVACDQVSVEFAYSDNSLFTLPAGTCATVTIDVVGNAVPFYQMASLTTLSRGRYSYAVPAIPSNSSTINEISSEISSYYTSQARSLIDEPEIFMSSSYQQFRNVTSMVLSEDDELVQAMVSAMSLSEATSIPAVLAEIKIVNNTIDILICYSAGIVDIATLMQMCSYNTVQLVVTTQQEINPIISKARGGSPLSSFLVYSLSSQITQIPAVINGTQLPVIPLSFQALKNATSDISHYMAALGQNAYMDWDQQAFFVIFNTSKIVQGLEVPVWILVLFGVITVACIALYVYVYCYLKKYRGSLYLNISQQLSQVEKDKSFKAPIIMPFKKDTKELGGFPILERKADDHDHDRDNNSPVATPQVSLVSLDAVPNAVDSDVSLLRH
ncbi:hypothetical protein BGZ49_010742 [Haplosporangium sp. Z 27]|nr:hypothetical protein BGZ49_010742 [Haplosporangium sp. Z 27]